VFINNTDLSDERTYFDIRFLLSTIVNPYRVPRNLRHARSSRARVLDPAFRSFPAIRRYFQARLVYHSRWRSYGALSGHYPRRALPSWQHSSELKLFRAPVRARFNAHCYWSIFTEQLRQLPNLYFLFRFATWDAAYKIVDYAIARGAIAYRCSAA